MRRIGLVLALALAAALVPGPAQGIVYGKLDGNRHPNVGALIYQRDDGTFGRICSGTLISQDVYLTAAHCTAALAARGVEPDDVWVTFAPNFEEDPELLPGTYDLNEAYNHRQSDPHDIAVVVLDDPVTDITPARLPRARLLSDLGPRRLRDRTFTAVGYGTVRESRKTGFQGILDNADRRYALQHFLSLQSAWLTLAMNEATGDGGTCYGDSGGPHFLGGVRSNLIVSITVTGDAVCKATDKTYRLDTPSARNYLDDFVTLP